MCLPILPKKMKAYTSATIKDNMLILNSQTKFKASHSETRVMFDKISSVDFSVTFGKRSAIMFFIGLIAMAIGIAFSFIDPMSSYVALPIALAIGLIFMILAFVLREHAVVISCCGDICSLYMGKKATDEIYARICAVLTQMHANDLCR